MLTHTRREFDICCKIFGIYLFHHFFVLYPSAIELFSSKGMIPDSTDLPSYGLVPNLLFHYDSPIFINYFVIGMMILSTSLCFEYFRSISSFLLFCGWNMLLNRNPFITNPGMAYDGLLLLVISVCSSSISKNKILSHGIWLIIGLSYTASGLHKLQCKSWLDGDAIYYVLTGPLARDNIIVWFLVNMIPREFLKLVTWGSLFIEISFLFLGCFHHMRKWYWLAIMGFHLGIIATVNFADLTLGVMMIHVFTFDTEWLKLTRKNNHMTISKSVVNNSKNTSFISTDDRINLCKWLIQASLVMISIIIFLSYCTKISIIDIIIALFDKSNQMYLGFLIIGGSLLFLMILERIFPHFEMKYVDGWWIWLFFIYAFQSLSVIIATFTWEQWFQDREYFNDPTQFHLSDYVTPFWGGIIGYIFNTWVFYWWHLARHHIYPLWILTHQMHHSPTRIETITSFYKHPIEIIVDAQIIALVSYGMLGLSPESSIWVSVFSAIGEYAYHMNIRTPKIIGWLFQRPESHRLHHRINSRLKCPNYADIPIWDILNGTFDNPDSDYFEETGFPGKEVLRWDMIFLKDVLNSFKSIYTLDYKSIIYYALIIFGSANSFLFMCHTNIFRDIGFVSVASPLPLVFSAFEGYETFSNSFFLEAELKNGTHISLPMDSSMYDMIGGAYNRKNVYGAMFSHGPFFIDYKMLNLRDKILHYAVCDPGTLMKDFKINSEIKWFNVTIKTKRSDTNLTRNIEIYC